MFKDFEVLSFSVDFEKEYIELVEKLEHFDKAPFGINNDTKEINFAITNFFGSRMIDYNRLDFPQIMSTTGCKSAFELAFKGHGLSLSNHYWFRKPNENLKYEEINFFTNKWDDSFARAVLSKDYEKLKNCDLNVPDLFTAGWGIKGWIYDDGPKLYKLGIHDGNEECVGEVLSSRLAARLFAEGECLKYELKQWDKELVSVCSPIITFDEELIPLSNVLKSELYSLYRNRTANKLSGKQFFEQLKNFKEINLTEFFIKISVLRDLCFASDIHFGNIGVIRNLKTGELKVAPIYDLGSSFGSSRTAKSFMENLNKSTMFLIYFIFNDLDPDWDYSWYNPDKLIGFEDEIVEYLSKSEFYTPEKIEAIIDVYHHQKSILDDYASKARNK